MLHCCLKNSVIYFTFLLVASKRINGKVRQQTLLNLGRNFALPKEEWPQLCGRIEEILSGQVTLLPVPEQIEKLAQWYAGRLVINNQTGDQQEEKRDVSYQEVDIASLEMIHPRSIGVEHAGLSAMQELGMPRILAEAGLANTYFEGKMADNPEARRGHSKERRTDCPLVTLGLIRDGSGFVRRSRMFKGNAIESSTLEEILQGLGAPDGALVIMDRGIATENNSDWLIEHHYRSLVVSRERHRQYDTDTAVAVTTASDKTAEIQRALSVDGTEVRLYCHSEERQEKEMAMVKRFTERFEGGLAKLAAGLLSPRGEKRRDKILQRIGRRREKSHGIGQHYRIEVTPDETGIKGRIFQLLGRS